MNLCDERLSEFLQQIIINNRTYHHKTIKQEKVKCMGYVYDGGIQPKHWMQFAYDTAIVTALDSDN